MIYSRIPEHDVYVLRLSTGKLACSLCSFGDMLETVYHPESTQEMIDHLAAHERKGDRIPETITQQLLDDDAINFPAQPPRL